MLRSFLTLFFFAFAMAALQGQKINGISFVGTAEKCTNEHLQPVQEIEANYVALMPFAYGKMGTSNLKFDQLNWQWWGESYEGVKATAILAKDNGIKSMIKPQIWFDWGTYTGNFELDNEEDWGDFEASYSKYILQYAELSEELDLPILRIGTELTEFAIQREDFWRNLIAEARMIYRGKLTYAANWDAYERIAFWDALDYIGIDAYFPISTSQTPNVNEVQKGWDPHVKAITRLQKRTGRPVIFTEWGYRSVDHNSEEPWNYDIKGKVNLEAQKNAIEGTFNRIWSEDWFAGGFIWKWFPNHARSGGEKDNQFTPQNKPAQNIIREWFNATKEK